MSIRLVSIALQKTFRDISKRQPSAVTLKIVAISLLDHANDEGISIHPSIAKTAARTDLTRRSVSNALAFFRRQGFFEPVGVVGHKKQVIDYRCNVARLLALPDAQVDPAPQRTSERDSQVNEIHTYQGISFIRTSERDSQLTVSDNRQDESSGDTRSRAKPEKKRASTRKKIEISPEDQAAETEIVYALKKATGVSGSWQRLKTLARDLKSDGWDARDILGLYVGERSAWKRFDFRGKKGELPTLYLIPHTIASLANQARASSSTDDDKPQTRQAKILALAREKTEALRERTGQQ